MARDDHTVRAYHCELCRTSVRMTPAEANAANNRVRCAACTASAAKSGRVKTKTAARRVWRPECSRCGSTSQPRKHYRLNERNWSEHVALLCTPCAKTLSYTPYDWTRIAHGIASVGKGAT